MWGALGFRFAVGVGADEVAGALGLSLDYEVLPLEVFGNDFKTIGREVHGRLFKYLDLLTDLPVVRLHYNKVYRRMAELIELIKSKNKPINSDELAGMMNSHFTYVEKVDLNAIIDVHVPRETELSVLDSQVLAETVIREVEKVQGRVNSLGHFYCNSILKLEKNKIVIK